MASFLAPVEDLQPRLRNLLKEACEKLEIDMDMMDDHVTIEPISNGHQRIKGGAELGGDEVEQFEIEEHGSAWWAEVRTYDKMGTCRSITAYNQGQGLQRFVLVPEGYEVVFKKKG